MNGDFDFYFRKAVELAGDFHPVDCPTEEDWERVQREIGSELPTEHKRFVSRFGSGRFGNDIYLLNPRAKGPGQLSAKALRNYAEQTALLLAEMPRRVYPNGTLVLLATTTSRLDWFVDGARPKELVFFDLGLYRVFNLPFSFAEFVCKLYAGDLKHDWAESVKRTIWSASDAPFFKPMANL